jgi:hypothetical protein
MDNEPRQTSSATAPRFFAESGHTVGEPFVRFLEHFGLTVCGLPVTEVLIENGVKTQYFQNLALEELAPGQVRVKPLGEIVLAAKRRDARRMPREGLVRPDIVDVAASLPRHGSRTYPLRTLSDIRYIVIHHSGASSDVGVRAIAGEHVVANDWPGIGYHFVISADGTIFRTQDLTVVCHHARQFNPVSVGVALLGDLSSGQPTAEQLRSAADLVAGLLSDLGLPPDAVRGHREMVPTPCPGETFLSVWKPRLMQSVAEILGEPIEPSTAAVPAAAVPAGEVPVAEVPVGEVPAAAVPVGEVPATAVPVGMPAAAPDAGETAAVPVPTADDPPADSADDPDDSYDVGPAPDSG